MDLRTLAEKSAVVSLASHLWINDSTILQDASIHASYQAKLYQQCKL